MTTSINPGADLTVVGGPPPAVLPSQPGPLGQDKLEPAGAVSVATVTRMHRVPAHTIAGCPLQLMAEVSALGTSCDGVVRFFDQFGLLGAATVDPESGIATLPYVFTSGGRRELAATFDGGTDHASSRSALTPIQVYSTTGPTARDIIRTSL